MNTKVGTTTIVQAFPQEYVSNVARSFLAFKHAQIFGVRLPFRQVRTVTTEVLISVDIETDQGFITEIGAWAFGAEQIYGVYHQLADGLSTSVETLTGLTIVDSRRVGLDQEPMLKEFSDWVRSISEVRTFLHWHGDDLSRLRFGPGINVGKQFDIWLQQTGQDRRANRTLTDAVNQVLGPNVPFVPHRAFEDAVLTGAIYIAITNSGGTV